MAIDVTFKRVGPGRCSWCQKDKKEVFEVTFADGTFDGPLCPIDFRCAIRLKAGDRKVGGSVHGEATAD
jgi:hypothetical protein